MALAFSRLIFCVSALVVVLSGYTVNRACVQSVQVDRVSVDRKVASQPGVRPNCKLYVAGQNGSLFASGLQLHGTGDAPLNQVPLALQSFAHFDLNLLRPFDAKGYRVTSLTEESLLELVSSESFEEGDQILRVVGLTADTNMRRMRRRMDRAEENIDEEDTAHTRRIIRRIRRMNVEFKLYMTLLTVISKSPFVTRTESVLEASETKDLNDAKEILLNNLLLKGIADEMDRCQTRS